MFQRIVVCFYVIIAWTGTPAMAHQQGPDDAVMMMKNMPDERLLRIRKPCYTARMDTRKCASPLCGGYFLKRTKGKTQCPNSPSTTQDECYAAFLDLSRLSSDDQQNQENILDHAICGYFQKNQINSSVFDFVVTRLKVLPVPPAPTCNCGKGMVCVDDPADDCVGCDCPTICQASTGFLSCSPDKSCPTGLTCIDNPNDSCVSECGDAGCDSICVEMHPDKTVCGGFAGFQCPGGYECYDNPSDECNSSCGGADCGGFCGKNPVGAMCGGFAGIPCAKGLECVDPLKDECDISCGGADCSGVCLLSS